MVDTPELWRPLADASLNDPITGSANPDIVQLSNGDIIVGWTSSNSAGVGVPNGLDIIGARYEWHGNRVPGEFRLNTSRTADDESDQKLAAVPNGDYFNVYVDRDAGSSTIYLNRFNVDGSSDGGVVIDSQATANFHGSFDVAATSNTNAVVFYVQNEASGTDRLYSRTYNPTTGAVGTETFVIQNGTFTDDILAIEATALTGGGYAIALRIDTPGNDDEIWAVRTDSSGVLLDYDRIPATMGNAGNDTDPTIAALSNGGYVVAWTTASGTIMHQRFNSSGGLVGAAQTLSIGGNLLNEPAIAGLADGGYVIVVDNDSLGQLVAYHFNSAGTQLGGGLVLATGAAVQQPDVKTLADGRVAVSWYDATAGVVDMSIIDTRDTATLGDLSPTDVHVGTIRNDTFTASSGSFANGWDGNDHITDGPTNETIRGGTGNDTIVANGVTAGDSFQGNSGTDTLILTNIFHGTVYDGTAGTLTSGTTSQTASNFEVVIGSSANEILRGRDLGEVLTGRDGNDTIEGRGGADTLNGNAGDDSLRGGGGSDTMRGQTGNDTLRGDGGNDFVQGEGGADRVFGDTGDDRLHGGGGNDIVLGGVGNDLLRGGNGDDTLAGNEHNDRLFGDAGLDRLNGGSGADTLDGGDGDDVLLGAGGRDLLRGGANDDILTGGAGHDTLIGNGGFDRFVFADDHSDDVVRDWQNGTDIIDFSASAQINNFNQFLNAASQTADGVLVEMADGTSILFENKILPQFDASDFIF